MENNIYMYKYRGYIWYIYFDHVLCVFLWQRRYTVVMYVFCSELNRYNHYTQPTSDNF